MTQTSKNRFTCAFLLLGAVLTAALFPRVPYPFIWLDLYGLIASFWIAYAYPQALKFGVNGLIVLTVFLAFEVPLSGAGSAAISWSRQLLGYPAAPVATEVAHEEKSRIPEEPITERAVAPDFFRDDWNLGYGPIPSATIPYKTYWKGKLLWDVTFHIDENKLRVVPRPAGFAPKASALFFCDSFTFGFGVNDEEAYPARYQQLAGPTLKVVNFGFQGHGAHQMLRRLEVGGERRVIDGLPPLFALYLGNPDHVMWAGGNSGWDQAGPLYELDKSGSLYFAGHFTNPIWVRLERRLSRSAVIAWLIRQFRNHPAAKTSRAYDIARYAAIVARAREIFEERYPGARFHVYFWAQRHEKDNDDILKALAENHLEVTIVPDVLPDYRNKRTSYLYDDGHPTPWGHQQFANYLSRHAL